MGKCIPHSQGSPISTRDKDVSKSQGSQQSGDLSRTMDGRRGEGTMERLHVGAGLQVGAQASGHGEGWGRRKEGS